MKSLKSFVVALKHLKVDGTVLGDHAVQKAPPLLTATENQLLVVGRHQYQREQTDVLRHAFVRFVSTTKLFLLAGFQSAADQLTHTFNFIFTFQHHHFLAMTDIQRVNAVGGAFRE